MLHPREIFGIKEWGVKSIYLITDGKYHKLGVTDKRPEDRMREFQTGNAKNLEMVFAMEVPEAFDAESKIHETLEDFRIRGEWFDLNNYNLVDSVILHIKRFARVVDLDYHSLTYLRNSWIYDIGYFNAKITCA